MRALVTGGTGFVGSHLIEALAAQGDLVRAVVRPGSNRGYVESLGAVAVPGDLDDEASLATACAGCDIIYHAAARVEIVGSAEEFHRTTVAGTERLVAAANQARVRRFVYISSCGVYPPALMAKGEVITERTVVPEPPRWFMYGRAKFHAEQAMRRRLDPAIEWVIVRLGYLYGPRNRTMHSHLAPLLRDPIMNLIGDAQNEMALVDVRDAVAAVVKAGRVPEAAGQVLIAGGNERVTQQEYFDALADGFGLPRIRKHVPYKVAYLFGWLGEYLVRSGPRRMGLRRSAVALTGLPQRLDCTYTQKLLDWKPRIRFADGMREAFEWYRREYQPSPGCGVGSPPPGRSGLGGGGA